jgi:hypothetical protein
VTHPEGPIFKNYFYDPGFSADRDHRQPSPAIGDSKAEGRARAWRNRLQLTQESAFQVGAIPLAKRLLGNLFLDASKLIVVGSVGSGLLL